MEKILFAIGSVAVFEGFFLAIAPGRIPKVLEMLSKRSNSELSRMGLIIRASGVASFRICGI